MLQLRPKTAVAIIDMQLWPSVEGRLGRFSYNHGTVPEGIARLCGLLDCAKRLGIPVALVELVCTDSRNQIVPPILPELTDAIRGYEKGRIIPKPDLSAFSNPEFRTWLDSYNIGKLVVAGYHRIACVQRTVRDALLVPLEVVTSGELIFGGNNDHKNQHENAAAIEFFKSHTTWFDSVSGVMEHLEVAK